MWTMLIMYHWKIQKHVRKNKWRLGIKTNIPDWKMCGVFFSEADWNVLFSPAVHLCTDYKHIVGIKLMMKSRGGQICLRLSYFKEYHGYYPAVLQGFILVNYRSICLALLKKKNHVLAKLKILPQAALALLKKVTEHWIYHAHLNHSQECSFESFSTLICC